MKVNVKTIKDNGSIRVIISGTDLGGIIQTTAKTHAMALRLISEEEGLSNPVLVGKTRNTYFWEVTTTEVDEITI